MNEIETLDAQLKADLQAEKEAREACEEEARLATITIAYEQGYYAGWDRIVEKGNPCQPGSQDHVDWLKGLHAGYRDQREWEEQRYF